MALEQSDVWISKSVSGKGIRIYVGKVLYTAAVSQVQRLLNDEIKGVRLSIQTDAPEASAVPTPEHTVLQGETPKE